jgi:hypothetical protein
MAAYPGESSPGSSRSSSAGGRSDQGEHARNLEKALKVLWLPQRMPTLAQLLMLRIAGSWYGWQCIARGLQRSLRTLCVPEPSQVCPSRSCELSVGSAHASPPATAATAEAATSTPRDSNRSLGRPLPRPRCCRSAAPRLTRCRAFANIYWSVAGMCAPGPTPLNS